MLRRLGSKQGAEQFLGNVDAVLVGNVEAQLDRHANLEAHGLEPCRTKDQVMALRRRNERAGKRIIVDFALDAQPRMNSERQLGGDLSRQVDYGVKLLFIVEGIDHPLEPEALKTDRLLRCSTGPLG